MLEITHTVVLQRKSQATIHEALAGKRSTVCLLAGVSAERSFASHRTLNRGGSVMHLTDLVRYKLQVDLIPNGSASGD